MDQWSKRNVTGTNIARDLTFDHLLTFKAVVESGSFRQAAEILVVSQPAISQRIRHIESILNLPLFDRERGSAALLTPFGEQLLVLADGILQELERFADRIDTLSVPGTEGDVTMAAGPSFIKYRLLVVAQEFIERHPDIGVRLKHTTSPNQVLEIVSGGQAGLGIYPGSAPSEHTPRFALASDRFMLMAPPGHDIFEVAPVNRLEMLSRTTLALPSDTAHSRQLVEGWARHYRVTLRMVIEADNLDTLKEAVLQHVALAILPTFATGDEVEEGLLRPVEIPGLPLERRVSVIGSPKKTPTVAERAFIAILQRHVREQERRFREAEQAISGS